MHSEKNACQQSFSNFVDWSILLVNNNNNNLYWNIAAMRLD